MKRIPYIMLLPLAALLMSFATVTITKTTFAAQSKDMQGVMDALRQLDPKAAQSIEARQTANAPSEQGKAAQEAALANAGTITIVNKDSGTVLKTLQVNPVEAIASSQGGDLFIELLNPARLSIWLQNRVLPDLYKYEGQFPQTRRGASVLVGQQFSGTRFSGKCDVTIAGHNGNVFTFELRNCTGAFIDSDKKTQPALASGVIQATYVGKRQKK